MDPFVRPTGRGCENREIHSRQTRFACRIVSPVREGLGRETVAKSPLVGGWASCPIPGAPFRMVVNRGRPRINRRSVVYAAARGAENSSTACDVAKCNGLTGGNRRHDRLCSHEWQSGRSAGALGKKPLALVEGEGIKVEEGRPALGSTGMTRILERRFSGVIRNRAESNGIGAARR